MYQLIVARRNLIISEVKLRGRKLKKIKSASPGLQLYQVSIAVYRYMLLFYHMHAYTLFFIRMCVKNLVAEIWNTFKNNI